MQWWVAPAVIVGLVVAYNLKDPVMSLLAEKPIGSWRYYVDKKTQQVEWTLDIPDEMLASVAIHMLSWRLFYLQGQREEPMLIDGVRRLLADADDCDWTLVDEVPATDTTFGLSGGVFKSGFIDGYPGVIGAGSQNRVEAALGSTLVILQKALKSGGETEAKTRAAALKLLEMHASQGPAGDLGKVLPRAKQALS